MPFEPLRITAELGCGVICDRWLPLDGILLYYAAAEQLVEKAISVPGGAPADAADIAMPLAVVHSGTPHWYYACSWAYPQPWWLAEGQDHWNKRFDDEYAALLDRSVKRVVIEKGTYKAYHMPVFYYIARQVHWFTVGDSDAIARLLRGATHIGKKREYGWGRVLRWRVEPWQDDWSRYGPDGRLMRGVPVVDDECIETNPLLINYAIRPPGYVPANQMALAVSHDQK